MEDLYLPHEAAVASADALYEKAREFYDAGKALTLEDCIFLADFIVNNTHAGKVLKASGVNKVVLKLASKFVSSERLKHLSDGMHVKFITGKSPEKVPDAGKSSPQEPGWMYKKLDEDASKGSGMPGPQAKVPGGGKILPKPGDSIHVDDPQGKLKDLKFPESYNVRKLRAKFDEHKTDFGLAEKDNLNNKNLDRFIAGVKKHIVDPDTQVIKGTYRKTDLVIHHYNPKTGVNVMFDQQTQKFVSGWKLAPHQKIDLLNNGHVQ
jgi:hypothetical protein